MDFYNYINSDEFILYQNIVSFVLLAVFSYPLYKLSRSRVALLILLSKTLGTTIFATLPIIYYAFKVFKLPPILFITPLFGAQSISTRLHLLALAINRFHCVIFPIHYANNVGKRLVISICVAIWLFSTSLAASKNSFQNFFSPSNPFIFNLVSSTTINQFAVFTTAFLYACVSARLLHLHFKPSDIGRTNKEKNHIKICIVCMTGLVPFLAMFLLQSIYDVFSKSNNKLAAIITSVTMTFVNSFCILCEDLCLLAICQEFRRVFFFRKSEANLSVENNKNGEQRKAAANVNNLVGPTTTSTTMPSVNGMPANSMAQVQINNYTGPKPLMTKME